MKKYIKFLIIIFSLIVIDQGSKLIVAHFFDGDIVLRSNNTRDSEIMLTSDTFHIHPLINDSTRQELLQKASNSSLSIGFFIFIDIVRKIILWTILILGIYVFSRLFTKLKMKRHPKITSSVICLPVAACLCNCMELILRGGSLDFMCITRKDTIWLVDHYHPVVRHQIWDIKDMYLVIGCVLLLLLVILVIIDYLKLSKDEKKELDIKLKNMIKNIFRSKKNNKQVL